MRNIVPKFILVAFCGLPHVDDEESQLQFPVSPPTVFYVSFVKLKSLGLNDERIYLVCMETTCLPGGLASTPQGDESLRQVELGLR